MHSRPKKGGSGSLSKWPLRSHFHIMKFSPPPPLSRISSSTKLRHTKKPAFLWSVIHKAVAVNKWHSKISADIDKSCPHCGPWSVKSMKHRFYNCPLAQQMWRYVANIIWKNHLPKERTSVHGNPFLWCNGFFFINLCARHFNDLVAYGCFWEAVFCGLSGTNRMIWFFLMICNGPLRTPVSHLRRLVGLW